MTTPRAEVAEQRSPATSLITIFAIPKAFTGHIGVIQRNAITSWTRLNPRPEIILFGDDQGTAEVAQELGVQYVPKVERNETGAPMLHDLFAQAEREARTQLLCYVNSDIILMDDFLKAVKRSTACGRQLMMVGRRWEIEQRELWNFDDPGWHGRLREQVRRTGRLQSTVAIDYFVFSRGLGNNLLPLALGRMGWDNWLIWNARRQKAAVVDASRVVMAVHQNHDYSHHPGGTEGVWRGPEAKRNRALIGDWYRFLGVEDANLILLPDRIRRSRRHYWLVVKRAWSHPAGMVRLIGRTLARPFRRGLSP